MDYNVQVGDSKLYQYNKTFINLDFIPDLTIHGENGETFNISFQEGLRFRVHISRIEEGYYPSDTLIWVQLEYEGIKTLEHQNNFVIRTTEDTSYWGEIVRLYNNDPLTFANITLTNESVIFDSFEISVDLNTFRESHVIFDLKTGWIISDYSKTGYLNNTITSEIEIILLNNSVEDIIGLIMDVGVFSGSLIFVVGIGGIFGIFSAVILRRVRK
jgi:hypothetical protein